MTICPLVLPFQRRAKHQYWSVLSPCSCFSVDEAQLNSDCLEYQTDPKKNVSQELLETNDQYHCDGIILEPKCTRFNEHRSDQDLAVEKEEEASVSASCEEIQHTVTIEKPEAITSGMQEIMEPPIGKNVSEHTNFIPHKVTANAAATEECRVSFFIDSVAGRLEKTATSDLLANMGVLKSMSPVAGQVTLRANKSAKSVRRKVTTSASTNRVVRGLPVKESYPQALDAREVRLFVVPVLFAGIIVALDGSTLSAV